MSFCFMLVVYRVPDFFYIFYTKIHQHKIKYFFLYQKFGVSGLQDIKIIYIYMFIL